MSVNKRKIVILTIFFISMIVFWAIRFNYNIFNSNKDNADYALMGRQLVEGKGFSTLQIFPKHIPYLKSKNLLDNENWPNLYRYPLPIVLNALAQLIIGDPVKSAIVLSGVMILLGAFFIFLIVNKTSGFYQGIFVASIFFIDSLIAGYSGMSEPIATVLLILIVFFLIVPNDQIVFYALTGIFSGFLLLARTQYLFFIVLIFLYYFHRKKSWKKIFVYLLLIILIITPWLIRNYKLTGNPVFSFTVSRGLLIGIPGKFSLPEYSITSPPTVNESIRIKGDKILNKIKINLMKIVSIKFWMEMFYPLSLLLIILFLSIFFKFKYRFLSILTSLAIVMNFLILCSVFHGPRYYFPLRSLLILSSSIFVFEIITRINLRNNKRFLNFVLSFVSAILVIIFFSYRNGELNNYKNNKRFDRSKMYNYIINNIDTEDIIVSDIAYKISLFTKRKSMRIPTDLKELYTIDRDYLRLDYLLLKPSHFRKNLFEKSSLKNGILFGKFKKIKTPFRKPFVFKRINNLFE